ncbi:MAG TPA: penicillin-binding transpeptidase domain-containing protein [Clostridia bacterium]
MPQKRAAILFATFFTMLILLIVRLGYLQLLTFKDLSKAATSQRVSDREVDISRGDIEDRNGIPLTNRTVKTSVVLMPLYIRGKQVVIDEICTTLNQDPVRLTKDINAMSEPIIIEAYEDSARKLLSQNLGGISVVHSLERYDENAVAKHILGYVSSIDKKGLSGIEKKYDNILKSNNPDELRVVTDAKDNLIKGIGYRVIKGGNREKDLNVKLTLDYHIQKAIEDVMNKKTITGAVIVEDVVTGDILGIASKPDFYQLRVGDYLESSKKELFNRAVGAYNLGSVFKIVDVACCFEYGIDTYNDFNCNGSIMVGDRQYKCSSYESGGHGVLNLDGAFAKSCNPYFIKLGIDLGPKRLLDMAGKFGFGKATGVNEQGIDESAGVLPQLKSTLTDGDTANISIGQGNLMATPLQVVDMVATVANGGIKNRVNIVDSIVDSNGKAVNKIRMNKGERIISKSTSDKIKKLMEEVVSDGTGKRAGINQYGGAGGKTGTAETGEVQNGEKVVQAWFAGYFPVGDPRYSMVVFVENGKSGAEAAAPVFGEIASGIMSKGY